MLKILEFFLFGIDPRGPWAHFGRPRAPPGGRAGRGPLARPPLIAPKRSKDGWNRGKFGLIDKFLQFYENIEREKAEWHGTSQKTIFFHVFWGFWVIFLWFLWHFWEIPGFSFCFPLFLDIGSIYDWFLTGVMTDRPVL